MYKTFFCLFSLFVIVKTACAQHERGQLVYTTKEVKMAIVFKKQAIKNSFNKNPPYLFSKQQEIYIKEFQPQFITAAPTLHSFFSFSLTKLPEDYYNSNIGWACKQELKIEKATNIPLRIRLGSIEQVNYLEGKTAGH
jgi:hypothetical protein